MTVSHPSKINIITLGCSKNIVDSENIMTQLKRQGIDVVYEEPDSDADTVIINTCGFIADAKQESIDLILEFVEAKNEGLIKKLYVTGCLSERYKDLLKSEIPEVDEYFGARTITDIVEKFVPTYRPELLYDRIISTPKHYAYLKIAEGCDRRCAFCAIPLIRGKHKSVPMEVLVEQARNLIKNGVKEILLISQDLSYYGIDIYKQQKLHELVRKLSSLQGLQWLRLHYAYPHNFQREIIDLMVEEPNICNYLDIPVQHISDNVLKKMRRGHSSKSIYELIDFIRKRNPEIALRTTLLVGHPGETEEDFRLLYDFVEQAKFDRLGVFVYSEEEGTFAANNYTDDIPYEVKRERASAIMNLQEQISLEKNFAKIGNSYKVLVDRREDDYYIGRTEFDSPEVDNEVLIPAVGKYEDIKVGEFYDFEIINADAFDLYV